MKVISIFLFFSLIVFALQNNLSLEHVEVRRSIIDSYMEGSPKELFKTFHFVFQKPYSLNSETALIKYKIFKDNLEFIKTHNAKKLSWTLEVNFFADLTDAEREKYMGIKPTNFAETEVEKNILNSNKYEIFDKLLENENKKRKLGSFDFFDKLADKKNDPTPPKDDPTPPKETVDAFDVIDFKKYLSIPRDQGNCGSCWTFAAALTVESRYNMKKTNTTDYLPYTSTQELVDCSKSGGFGCSGGWMHWAYKYFALEGVELDADYPYTATNGVCKVDHAKIIFKLNPTKSYSGCSYYSDYFDVPECTKAIWHESLSFGPIAVIVMAERNFSFYKSGIIDSSLIDCTSFNHAVVAYGFKREYFPDETEFKEYVEIRNSWGYGWGDKGDIRYYYNEANGTCWISKMAFYPLF